MDRTNKLKSQDANPLCSRKFEELGMSSGLILPITIDELTDAVKALRAVTLRDAPHFQQVQVLHQQLETATGLSVSEEQALIRTGSTLLVGHIAMLERALHAAANELGQDVPTHLLRAQKFDGRCEALHRGFEAVALKYATEWFVPSPGEYNSKYLPPPIEQLVRDVCRGLFEFGLVGRSFSKEAFTKWLRMTADVWEKHVYKKCVSIDGDGAEYMFGDSPKFTYNPELDSKDKLRHLVPPFKRHYHLGFNDSATSTLKTLWSSGVALHHLLGKRIIPFLDGGVMLQELGATKEFSPQLSIRRAKHEGALGLEVAFHIDLPISQIELALGSVDIRFLDESTPIIVRSQGASFDSVEKKAVLLRGATEARSLFIEKLDSHARRDDRKQMFIESRRIACSEVGVRQATDAAVFAALIILKELGFKQVCGVSDSDQGALLDRREEEGSELEIYDPLFARLGFCPPMFNESRFWTFNLEELRMWNGEQDVRCEGLEDYFARVLVREVSSKGSENRSTWDARARLNENSKQLGKFSEILLTGAISLANSIKSGKEFKQLASHPDLLQE